MTHPTDALRLVPILKSWCEGGLLQSYEQVAERLFSELAAAPASPLAEGGGPTCQVCGGVIEAWICQGCGAQFHESDAGSLVLGMATAEPAGQLSKNLGQRKSEHIGETTEKVDLDALEKLAAHHVAALRELERHNAKGICYWFRPKAMERLHSHGLAEQWTPPSVKERPRIKKRPWRITHAGRAFLSRNGKSDLQKMQNNAPRNAPRGLSDEC